MVRTHGRFASSAVFERWIPAPFRPPATSLQRQTSRAGRVMPRLYDAYVHPALARHTFGGTSGNPVCRLSMPGRERSALDGASIASHTKAAPPSGPARGAPVRSLRVWKVRSTDQGELDRRAKTRFHVCLVAHLAGSDVDGLKTRLVVGTRAARTRYDLSKVIELSARHQDPHRRGLPRNASETHIRDPSAALWMAGADQWEAEALNAPGLRSVKSASWAFALSKHRTCRMCRPSWICKARRTAPDPQGLDRTQPPVQNKNAKNKMGRRSSSSRDGAGAARDAAHAHDARRMRTTKDPALFLLAEVEATKRWVDPMTAKEVEELLRPSMLSEGTVAQSPARAGAAGPRKVPKPPTGDPRKVSSRCQSISSILGRPRNSPRGLAHEAQPRAAPTATGMACRERADATQRGSSTCSSLPIGGDGFDIRPPSCRRHEPRPCSRPVV